MPRLLMLTHRVPFPPDKGDRIRTFNFLRFLSARAEVLLACLADEPVTDESRQTLERYCHRLAILPAPGPTRWLKALGSLAWGRSATEAVFQTGSLRRLIRAWAGEIRFDAVIASSSGMAPYCRLPELRGIPALIDLMDVDSQKWFDYAGASRGPRAWLYRLEGRRLRRYERALAGSTHALTLVSQTEVDLFRRHCPSGRVYAIANGVDLEYFRPTAPVDRLACVFVGALDYRPNVEGACWFCERVWPEIQRRFPDATLDLVGRKPVLAVRRLERYRGVRLVGQVPDVRPYLGNAAVVVVPLQIARGIQNKVLEALAMERAVVASPQALEGLEVNPGQEVLAAASPEQWVEAISRLFTDEPLRACLGGKGRQFVENHHCWEHCLQNLPKLLGIQSICTIEHV